MLNNPPLNSRFDFSCFFNEYSGGIDCDNVLCDQLASKVCNFCKQCAFLCEDCLEERTFDKRDFCPNLQEALRECQKIKKPQKACKTSFLKEEGGTNSLRVEINGTPLNLRGGFSRGLSVIWEEEKISE